MSKKPSGRFLLTWNEKKDPEISEFFNNIEEGMYSHTLREVIKFYMSYKDGDSSKKPSSRNYNNSTNDSNSVFNNNDIEEKSNNNDDYTDINANYF